MENQKKAKKLHKNNIDMGQTLEKKPEIQEGWYSPLIHCLFIS